MANESTYTGISTLIANVYETALMAAQEGNIIAPHVTINDSQSSARISRLYSGGTLRH